MRYESTPEKKRFYNSAAWRKLSKYYAESKGWVCETCHNKNIDRERPLYEQLHCHHKTPLTDENVWDPSVALNEGNLVLLCRTCHNQAHGDDEEPTAPGLYFDENGMIRKREN